MNWYTKSMENEPDFNERVMKELIDLKSELKFAYERRLRNGLPESDALKDIFNRFVKKIPEFEVMYTQLVRNLKKNYSEILYAEKRKKK